ncbi:von Willebrand factor type A domain protein [Pirellulimonas nuda]|uniref:von Willebrand factor type A domain protein n=1 Tax=Pirellulimonas nuda TaxID=2528009 RepID=A0A518DE50_9BACT|nr:VWA domain-containing protein [Pirellulimonas nuda]QDU89712.1 von Willebrand factor type A domain protein [Pirellulimonas nuda]
MFSSPWMFTLLLLLPLVAWRLWSGARQTAAPFSSTEHLQALRPTWRQRLAWLPAALTLAAVAVTIVALARPREGREQTVVDADGIAIEMVVDRSGSMRALDFQLDGSPVDRLTAIKSVAGRFIEGDDDPADDASLPGRVGDLVGLVTFAGYADAAAPPTLDHAFVTAQLNQQEIATQRGEDGTAIGDAISLAVEKLTSLDDRQQEKVKSKVLVLLTDGENNAGEVDPTQAAELAKKLGVKIYTIGVGTRGRAPVPVANPFTGREQIEWAEVNLDEGALRAIASATEGKYFRATDTESLTEVYREIDLLEKTKIEEQHFVDYRELAIQPTPWGALTLPPLALVALGLLWARVILASTLFRELA